MFYMFLLVERSYYNGCLDPTHIPPLQKRDKKHCRLNSRIKESQRLASNPLDY